ncbi:TPA: hypothetical protein ACOQ77_005965 [Bacillus cereus]
MNNTQLINELMNIVEKTVGQLSAEQAELLRHRFEEPVVAGRMDSKLEGIVKGKEEAFAEMAVRMAEYQKVN